MHLKFAFLIVISGLLASYSLNSRANITVLDFDSFTDGQIIDSEYLAEYGVSVESVNYIDGIANNGNEVSGRQVAFNTLNNNSYDDDLEYNNNSNDYNNQDSAFHYTALNLPGYTGSSNPGNILILQENGSGCGDGVCDRPDDEGSRAAGYFTFTFSNVVNILNIDFFDIEDKAGQDDSYSEIHFFDQDNNEVHQGNFIPGMGDGQFFRQDFQNITGVKRLVLNMPGSGGLDNLAFETTDVPEPVSIAIFVTALLFFTRRKQAKLISAEQQ
ncbi:MAG: hypothetical protein ACI88A_001425 [Paraglaciecola sp.]|jgi:hypothetical protein